MIQTISDNPPRFLDGEGREMTLPETLKMLRKDRGWSTEDLGKVLGVSDRTIENWEQDRRKMPLTAVLLLTHII